MDDIQIYNGGLAIDDRGSVSFVNEFNFATVKRFYKIENFSTNVIRAFHGHLKEGKYVFVTQGSIILAAVYLDNIDKPKKDTPIFRQVFSSKKPTIIFIPPKYANGFKALEDNTQVLFFSTSTLEDSKGDDYRYPADYWGNDIWNIEDR